MNFNDYLSGIRIRLIISHGDLLSFLKLPEGKLAYRPTEGGWTIQEILEHVGLTSHFLLILIDKASGKARRKGEAQDLSAARDSFLYDPQRLQNIGRHKSFSWERPDHMEPTGEVKMNTVADQLADQLQRCLCHLIELKNGEGLFHTTTMSVDGLGRLNVYEYIDFLARHVERHVGQISKTLAESQS